MATWQEQFNKQLVKRFGASKTRALQAKYRKAFPGHYFDECTPHIAAHDIQQLETLTPDQRLVLDVYEVARHPQPIRLRLYQGQTPIPLSDLLPLLENLGLRTYGEQQYVVTLGKSSRVWINEFSFFPLSDDFKLQPVKTLFEEAFTHLYWGHAENDGLNKLILNAGLTWREIIILRAYIKYMHQIGFRFTADYIERALTKYTTIARTLVALFYAKHKTGSRQQCDQLEKQLFTALVSVSSLDDDHIIRHFIALIRATVRTNYYQPPASGQSKTYYAFKLSSRDIPGMPLPTPLYEIFVYATQFEGIHLRYTKIARGGIRWSDRQADFRTEILGLMKAQVVKNAVIVPSGAKGGFVLKTTHAVGVECYQQFIRGLLELTDNIRNNQVVHPKGVICYDDADPYLVVAADKGTATFSDIANRLALEYQFWLGDAFASGGSAGYDHKKMGITARGAWESIKRHFLEKQIDIHKQNITVVGIGDMSGDVFGNGLLYSKHIQLVAAFDHRHIFMDPNPDPAVSYKERSRLFRLASSSWEDYNVAYLSKGGGIFKRSLKAITLSPEMQRVLATDATTLTPNELIRVILKAPVNLLFNGGIGTYVKASTESHADVGDRTNEYCRINGNELRCMVVGEGGNLGLTQLGRVEYALQGGLINTDSIDNSAGVDCSDHEVNLKILLNAAIANRKLTLEKRNQLLVQLTSSVASHVLRDNYSQALVMNFTAYRAAANVDLHLNYIKALEAHAGLDRHVEHLPDDKTLLERKASGQGLSRPELAVLLSYSKIYIKHAILETHVVTDPYLAQWVSRAFPEAIAKTYGRLMQTHRLHDDIIATQLSNMIVNQVGLTFVYRLQVETGLSIADIVRAYVIASQVFDVPALQQVVESLDAKIACHEQYEMLFRIRHFLHVSTRWFLRSQYLKQDIAAIIQQFRLPVQQLEQVIPNLMSGDIKAYLGVLETQFTKLGLSKTLAKHIASYRAIYNALNIIDIVIRKHLDLIKVASVYFAVGERLNLVWFRDQLLKDNREGHWSVMARLTLRDELDECQRLFTIAIIKRTGASGSPKAWLEKWVAHNPVFFTRWEQLLSMLRANTQVEYAMFFIALRELLEWVKIVD